ncbi:MAG: hypothetical protein IK130_07980 [Oscillospiraceae bacterium]|nr:hypothetical protein [Oscillospiraceae bacterium]
MQHEYFLGGASQNGFETAFWDEQKHHYGFLLKGGPGTGKSTLMKTVAAAFAEEPVSVYHCASDPRSLDAVVLEQRGVYIADATAPHTADTPLPFVTGETVDLAAGLDRDAVRESGEQARVLYAENQAMHMQVRQSLRGLASMQTMYTDITAGALLREKLAAYAERFCKRLLPRSASGQGVLLHRQCSALTPDGRVCFQPANAAVLYLRDNCMIAAQELLAVFAERAVSAGKCVEVTADLTQNGKPLSHVFLPETGLTVSAVRELPDGVREDATVIDLRRFYDSAALRKQRTLLRFCRETADAIEAETVAILREALACHDVLEQTYIGALDTAYLDAIAKRLTERIRTEF